MLAVLYFNQISHIIFSPSFCIFFMTLCTMDVVLWKPHYFLMHGYLLMYCVYNTLCISLNWWIHLHPLENKNSLKGQPHISLAVLEAYTDYFFLFRWGMKSEKETRKRQRKKRDTTSSIFKFHFLRELSPEVKN